MVDLNLHVMSNYELLGQRNTALLEVYLLCSHWPSGGYSLCLSRRWSVTVFVVFYCVVLCCGAVTEYELQPNGATLSI